MVDFACFKFCGGGGGGGPTWRLVACTGMALRGNVLAQCRAWDARRSDQPTYCCSCMQVLFAACFSNRLLQDCNCSARSARVRRARHEGVEQIMQKFHDSAWCITLITLMRSNTLTMHRTCDPKHTHLEAPVRPDLRCRIHDHVSSF